jgi:hypothetical protein
MWRASSGASRHGAVDGLQLHGDGAERVRQRVVQLARHAVAFVADGKLLLRGGVLRELGVGFVQRLALRPAAPPSCA